jgi:hypothetical protein
MIYQALEIALPVSLTLTLLAPKIGNLLAKLGFRYGYLSTLQLTLILFVMAVAGMATIILRYSIFGKRHVGHHLWCGS